MNDVRVYVYIMCVYIKGKKGLVEGSRMGSGTVHRQKEEERNERQKKSFLRVERRTDVLVSAFEDEPNLRGLSFSWLGCRPIVCSISFENRESLCGESTDRRA